jgi:hypothetical protein
LDVRGPLHVLLEAAPHPAGPAMSVQVRAEIIAPDVAMSVAQVEFGDVAVGHRVRRVLRVTNPTAVPCEW